MKTTLNKIIDSGSWSFELNKLLCYLNKTTPDDETLHLRTIVEYSGLNAALYCLRAVEGYDREKRLFAVWCAQQVKHLMNEQCINVLDVAKRYALGEGTKDELDDSYLSALYAFNPSANNAYNAATSTSSDCASLSARLASEDASSDYAWVSSSADTGYADRTASWAVAWKTAFDAAKDAQKAEFLRLLDCIDNVEIYAI